MAIFLLSIRRLTSGCSLHATSLAAGFVLAALAPGCARSPNLTAVAPATGYPRQLLAVDGTTEGAGVVWDVGLATETTLYNGLFGTSYFQIPVNAGAGDHPVAIRNSQGTSAAKHVTVLAPSGVFPAPRIEDIGVLGAIGGGPVDVLLTVAAANLDVDATVTVEEIAAGLPVAKTVSSTFRWGALPVDYLQHHQPKTFGYPVYHYTQLLSIVHGVAFASTLRVTVKNTDGTTATKDYAFPASISALDGDGDGLLDSWEDGSYAALSGNLVPLAAMGTNKWRKNILVEVDWIADAAPEPSVWQTVETVFKDAPVLNPDGSRGIDIIIDHGQGGTLSDGGHVLADHDCISFGNPAAGIPGCQNVKDFFDYKKDPGNFNQDRLHIFHYAIFGRQEIGGNSGLGERYGNDFLMTLLGPGPPQTAAVRQVMHFVHELGHNLGLTHGGLNSDDQNFPAKPNLLSVMTYTYMKSGVDVECEMKGKGLVTYSQGTLFPLDETLVDETRGICDGKPVDMNWVPKGPFLFLGDGQITVEALDVTGNRDTVDKSDDFDQWGNLLFKFDVSNSQWDND